MIDVILDALIRQHQSELTFVTYLPLMFFSQPRRRLHTTAHILQSTEFLISPIVISVALAITFSIFSSPSTLVF